jgi:hypothetical protein
MRQIVVQVAGLVIAGSVLAGCAGPNPTPSPTGPVATGPTSSPSAAAPTSCPGTPGTTPTPCTPDQLQELTTKAALYTEAEQVYRRFFEEDGKVTMAGVQASPEVLALMSPDYAASYQKQRDSMLGLTTNGYGVISYVQPAPGLTYKESEVALAVCEDGSTATAYRNGKTLGQLDVRRSIFYFERHDGSLKILWQVSAAVPSC